MTRHRLPHTRNKTTTSRPVRKTVNYLQRTFADSRIAPIITEDNQERPFQNIIDALLIDPKNISDDALGKMDLLPPLYSSFSPKAKDIYKSAIWRKVGFMLGG